MSEMTPFENKDAIATTTVLAQREGLRSIADLKRVKGLKLGARPEFEDLQLGLKGLTDDYGLTDVAFEPVELGQHAVTKGAELGPEPGQLVGERRQLPAQDLEVGARAFRGIGMTGAGLEERLASAGATATEQADTAAEAPQRDQSQESGDQAGQTDDEGDDDEDREHRHPG